MIAAPTYARPSASEIEAVLPDFIGQVSQVPPAFSAIKVDGERAYDLAREGIEVTLQRALSASTTRRLVEVPTATMR